MSERHDEAVEAVCRLRFKSWDATNPDHMLASWRQEERRRAQNQIAAFLRAEAARPDMSVATTQDYLLARADELDPPPAREEHA